MTRTEIEQILEPLLATAPGNRISGLELRASFTALLNYIDVNISRDLLSQILAEIRAGNSFLEDAGRNIGDAQFRPFQSPPTPNYYPLRTVHNAKDGAGKPVDVVITQVYSIGIDGTTTLASTTTNYLLENGSSTPIRPAGLVWINEEGTTTSGDIEVPLPPLDAPILRNANINGNGQLTVEVVGSSTIPYSRYEVYYTETGFGSNHSMEYETDSALFVAQRIPSADDGLIYARLLGDGVLNSNSAFTSLPYTI